MARSAVLVGRTDLRSRQEPRAGPCLSSRSATWSASSSRTGCWARWGSSSSCSPIGFVFFWVSATVGLWISRRSRASRPRCSQGSSRSCSSVRRSFRSPGMVWWSSRSPGTTRSRYWANLARVMALGDQAIPVDSGHGAPTDQFRTPRGAIDRLDRRHPRGVRPFVDPLVSSY